MITVKIDVMKIDKSKLFHGKNGAKYLDIVLIDSSQNDKFGNDYMVIQQNTKEEREKGIKGAILGNGKIVGAKRPGEGYSDRSGAPEVSADDIPF